MSYHDKQEKRVGDESIYGKHGYHNGAIISMIYEERYTNLRRNDPSYIALAIINHTSYITTYFHPFAHIRGLRNSFDIKKIYQLAKLNTC